MKIGDWILDNWNALMASIFFTSVLGLVFMVVYANNKVTLIENHCQQGIVVQTTEGWRCIDAKVIE